MQDINCSPAHYLPVVPGAIQSCGWLLQDMKNTMESVSQRIISPWNSLLTAVLPFLPKLRDKRPQGMSRVSKECSSVLDLDRLFLLTCSV